MDRYVERTVLNFQHLKTKVNSMFGENLKSMSPHERLTTDALCVVQTLESVRSELDSFLTNDGEDDFDEWLAETWSNGNEVPLPVDPNHVTDITYLLHSFKEASPRKMHLIPTKTFIRPKKHRSSLSCLVETTPKASDGSPKMRRRLTTTIDPSPALIPHLEHLAKENNRPVSIVGDEDIRWEDGAAEAEAEASGVTTPRSSRPAVPASLLQRLQELKEGNTVKSNPKTEASSATSFQANGPVRQPPISSDMTVSYMFREIPDVEGTNMESYLSLGEASLIGSLEMPADRRLTFGGVAIPTKTVASKLDSVPTDNCIAINRDMERTFIAVQQNATFIGSNINSEENSFSTYRTFHVQEANDENLNPDVEKAVSALRYSSKIFDSTFTTKREEVGIKRTTNGTFSKDDVQNTINISITENKLEDVKNETFSKNKTAEKIEYSTATYTRTPRGRSLSSFGDGRKIPLCVKSQENLAGRRSLNSSRDTLERSPARSDDGYRGNCSQRLIAGGNTFISPSRSDGTITPVEGRDGRHGTYTRNSPVERCASEDEQMSTTSDHSNRSRESVEDFPSSAQTQKKYQVSTPIQSDGERLSEEWGMSPISRRITPDNPLGSNGNISTLAKNAFKKVIKGPTGQAPLKQPLITPTDNFRRPVVKKAGSNPSLRAPTKSEPITARNITKTQPRQADSMPKPTSVNSNLPKPASKIPGQLPLRLSSIPRPRSSSRPSTAN